MSRWIKCDRKANGCGIYSSYSCESCPYENKYGQKTYIQIIDRLEKELTQLKSEKCGEWVSAGNGITARIICSNCRKEKNGLGFTKYCSECGAKMKKEVIKEIEKVVDTHTSTETIASNFIPEHWVDQRYIANPEKLKQALCKVLEEQLDRLKNKQVTCEECQWHCDRDGKHRCTRLHIYPEFSDFYCAFGEPLKEGE